MDVGDGGQDEREPAALQRSQGNVARDEAGQRRADSLAGRPRAQAHIGIGGLAERIGWPAIEH